MAGIKKPIIIHTFNLTKFKLQEKNSGTFLELYNLCINVNLEKESLLIIKGFTDNAAAFSVQQYSIKPSRDKAIPCGF